MTALAATPPPSAFPIAARAVHTPMPDRPGLVSVLVAVNGRRSRSGAARTARSTLPAPRC